MMAYSRRNRFCKLLGPYEFNLFSFKDSASRKERFPAAYADVADLAYKP